MLFSSRRFQRNGGSVNFISIPTRRVDEELCFFTRPHLFYFDFLYQVSAKTSCFPVFLGHRVEFFSPFSPGP